MNPLIQAVKAVIGVVPLPRFDPEADETVQFLREQRDAATVETMRLRRSRIDRSIWWSVQDRKGEN